MNDDLLHETNTEEETPSEEETEEEPDETEGDLDLEPEDWGMEDKETE